MTCEADESVFDQMKQRHYDREEDDDLELLDPPLFLKLRKEGKLKRSKSFVNGVNPSSQRIKPLFHFSSFAKVQPIKEVVVEDNKRSAAASAESLLKSQDASQQQQQQQQQQDTAPNEDPYVEYDECDPFSYMTDTFAFVSRKSPSLTATPTLAFSPAPSPTVAPSLLMSSVTSSALPPPAGTSSPLFSAHAQDYPGTPRASYSLGGYGAGLHRPTASSSAFGSYFGSNGSQSPTAFWSRGSSLDYSSGRTPGSLSSTPSMPPSDGDPSATTPTLGADADKSNTPSLKYTPFSYYS